ncbi:MAG: hypothetical protein IIA81_07670 [Thaumarchaeota archaeon]|nr:hypothetical protein [Nitrososphaerota archaeon]
MGHFGDDIFDFLLPTIYPVIALFIIEIICRATKITSWIKLTTQGIAMLVMGISYVFVLYTQLWFSILVLIALAVALFYQARRAKTDPAKTIY